MRGRWSFQTLYTFKVICFCIIRQLWRAFIIIHIPNGHTSCITALCAVARLDSRTYLLTYLLTFQSYLRRWCIMWIITKFSSPTPVRRPSAVNPAKIRTNLVFIHHVRALVSSDYLLLSRHVVVTLERVDLVSALRNERLRSYSSVPAAYRPQLVTISLIVRQ